MSSLFNLCVTSPELYIQRKLRFVNASNKKKRSSKPEYKNGFATRILQSSALKIEMLQNKKSELFHFARFSIYS